MLDIMIGENEPPPKVLDWSDASLVSFVLPFRVYSDWKLVLNNFRLVKAFISDFIWKKLSKMAYVKPGFI